jgi:hypothetical protein
MPYLLDANVFIQAKNLHYGMDFCPAFWDWLINSNAAGQVFSIERVANEIEAGEDELSDWAEQRGPGFFLRPDETVIPALGAVSTWATRQTYEPAAVNTFLQVADAYLVAHAFAYGHTVVTHERLADSRRIIRYPMRASASGSSSWRLTRCCGANALVLSWNLPRWPHQARDRRDARAQARHSVRLRQCRQGLGR